MSTCHRPTFYFPANKPSRASIIGTETEAWGLLIRGQCHNDKGFIRFYFASNSYPKGSTMTCWCGSLHPPHLTAISRANLNTMSFSCANQPLDLVSLTAVVEICRNHFVLLFWCWFHLLSQTLIQKRMSLSSIWPMNPMERRNTQLSMPPTTSASSLSLWSSTKAESKPEQIRR